jgi:peptide/nickel transport system substrate-binding protein
MTRKVAAATVAATAAMTLLAACTSGGTKNSGTAGPSNHSKGGVVTISNAQGQTWPCGFNPYNPSFNAVSLGIVYEPLVYINALKDSAETPMLASSYAWGPGKKSIVFTIRDGVKWSDGQPLTGADVAFTFNLMKSHPALDINALWTSILTGVSASGNKVTMTFKNAAAPYFFYIADQTGIVPQHIWSTGSAAKDPVQYQDAHPVGTGPFIVNPCRPTNITYTANPTYWQPGLPKLAKVQYPAYLDNGPANLDLATGKAQWGSQFIPGIDKFYVARDKAHNHYFFAPLQNVAIYFNLKHPVTGNLNVRKAFAYGINRADVSRVGEGGYQPAANQTGIVLPTFQKWYDAAADAQFGYSTPNAAKATQLLATAGYSKSHPVSLSIITISGYTDWDASLNEVKQQLKPLGINLTIRDLAQQTYNDKLYKGDFDLAYYGQPGGPTPYYELRQILYGPNSAPLGQNAGSNYERYSNPAVDQMFDEFATADDAKQIALVKQIQQSMLKDIPVVPTTESVDWYQYNDKNLTGWPTQEDPYSRAAAFAVPDIEQVLLHLHLK